MMIIVMIKINHLSSFLDTTAALKSSIYLDIAQFEKDITALGEQAK